MNPRIYLLGCLLYKLNPSIKLPQFVVTTTRIGADLNAVQSHMIVRANDIPSAGKQSVTEYMNHHLFGVNSSSQVSAPTHVSGVLMTASPKGT